MDPQDRRRHARVSISLPVSGLLGSESLGWTDRLNTSNVSAGGMYFHAPLPQPPEIGSEMSFVLTVPPGAGYSAFSGQVRGTGTVVRTANAGDGSVGIAIRFTQPLALDF
jgi:hypothetical protein